MQELNDLDSIATGWLSDLKKASSFLKLNTKNVRFESPFTDPFDDQIGLMISSVSDTTLLVSDQGYTIWNLEARGIKITNKRSTRYRMLAQVLKSNNVNFDSKTSAIYLNTTPKELPKSINRVLSAIMRISDFSYLNRDNVRGMFHNDVLEYVIKNKSRFAYDLGHSIIGESGMDFPIDYVFRQTIRDSKLTNLYTDLDKNRTTQIMGIWYDTKHYRETKYTENQSSFNIVIPTITPANSNFADHLREHGISVTAFDEKKRFDQEFAIQSA